ncbi:hypothetical protein BDR04DRAFT_1234240 [Suillus decipiens]|nr:hypothetical protein BDR04DRAFT_1234240 [Suillus decipiens]
MEERYGLQERTKSDDTTHVEGSCETEAQTTTYTDDSCKSSPNILPSNVLDHFLKIAGTLGTGLFLGTGGAIHKAGPLGALIAYVLVIMLTRRDDLPCPDIRIISPLWFVLFLSSPNY